MNCPKCQRVIYSRQQARCGYCGEPLPESMRLAPHEIDEIKSEIKEIDQRRAKAKEAEEREREATRRRNDFR
jgi:ribosomal protein L37E